jgi:hypothetical protein
VALFNRSPVLFFKDGDIMPRIKAPCQLSFRDSFNLRTVIPLLDKVQKGKTCRLIEGDIVRIVFEFIDSHDDLVLGLEIYGGYNTIESAKYSGHKRTEIHYNHSLKTGFISRKEVFPTYDFNNPKLVLMIKNKKSFIDFPLRMNFYKCFTTDEITGYTYISLL